MTGLERVLTLIAVVSVNDNALVCVVSLNAVYAPLLSCCLSNLIRLTLESLEVILYLSVATVNDAPVYTVFGSITRSSILPKKQFAVAGVVLLAPT